MSAANLVTTFVGVHEAFVGKHEVALLLGKSVSWVEKQSADRTFPSHKLGGHRRYRLSEIVEWAETQREAA